VIAKGEEADLELVLHLFRLIANLDKLQRIRLGFHHGFQPGPRQTGWGEGVILPRKSSPEEFHSLLS